MNFISEFVIQRNKNNITEKLKANNSQRAFEIYHESKAQGYRTRLYNPDGIQIAGIWR